MNNFWFFPQLVIDWDSFISHFQLWILQTISLRINHVQKDFIKSLIDPLSKNIVFKNSYLLFIKNFWELPSNRTKLLKGQINLSKIPKPLLPYDPNNDDKVLFKIHYLSHTQFSQLTPRSTSLLLTQKIFEFGKNKLYTLDPKFNIISQKLINTQNFLTIGRSQTNDIQISDCPTINSYHLKLIKTVAKKNKEKKTLYMFDEDENKNQIQNLWYLRDVSRSNRLQYFLNNDTTYIVMRPGLVVKIGLTDQYEISIIKATPQDVTEHHMKQIKNLLNADRINYLGEIDPSIPQKIIVDIPIKTIKPQDIQNWFNKGLNYQENNQNQVKKKAKDVKQEEELPLIIQLRNTVSQELKQFKFMGESVKVGRNSKQNKIVIDRVSIRNIQCEFVCITGVWMIKNVKQNLLESQKHLQNQKSQTQDSQRLLKRLKLRHLSVGVSTEQCVQEFQSSNRIYLPNNCIHEVGGKNFMIEIGLRQNVK